MNRRGFVGGMMAAGLGGNPPIRPDQAMQLQRTGAGSGPAPQSAFIVARRVVIIGTTGGLFVYSPTAGAGNLVASIAATGGTDSFGNPYLPGIVSYAGALPGAQTTALNGGVVQFTSNGRFLETPRTGPSAQSSLDAEGPQPFGGLNQAVWSLFAESSDATRPAQAVLQSMVVGGSPALPSTKALLEVQGDVQAGNGLSVGQGLGVQTLVNGSTISTAGITMQPVTALLSVTGLILQAGTFDGQFIVIPSDAGAGITMTFAAAATSNVKLGTGAVMQPGRANMFVWVASTSRWYLALTA